MLLLQHFTKQCTKCKEIKRFEMFSKDKYRKDGVKSNCKECANKYTLATKDIRAEYNRQIDRSGYNRAYYELNKEKLAISKREYQQRNKDSVTQYQREYQQKNREKISKQIGEYYQKNKEKRSIQNKAWRENNKTEITIKKREYYEGNKEEISIKKREYRKTPVSKASKKNSEHRRRSRIKTGDVTNEQLLQLEQTAKVCYWCKTTLKGLKVHIDHYEPLSKGGLHTLSNLVVSCQRCNNRKHAKDPINFANSIGRLF